MKAKDYYKLDLACARSREKFAHDLMLANLLKDDIYPCDFFYDDPTADYYFDEINFS